MPAPGAAGRASTLAALALVSALGQPSGAQAQSGSASARVEALGAGHAQVATARRGWFGFSFGVARDRRAGRQPIETVSIESVVSGSPADRAGLRSGDVLLRIDTGPATARSLDGVARRAAAGDTLRLRVRGAGGARDLTLVAAARPEVIHVVRGSRGGRLYLADSLVVRAQSVLDSIRADVVDVRMVLGEGASGTPAEVIIRDAVGEERRIRVRQGNAEEIARNLRAALDRQRASAPMRIQIESELQSAEELRRVVQDLERLRRDHARAAAGSHALRDSMLVWREVRPPPRYGLAMSATSVGIAGAEFRPLAPEMRPYFGVDSGLLVLSVGPGTPAARAGLLPGDVVITAGGRRARSVPELAASLREMGENGLTLDVIRQQKRRTIRIPGP